MRMVAIALLLVLIATAAQAENCADRAELVEKLASTYGEHFAGGGMKNSASIYEVWASDETGTWTILQTTPDGRSCIMASGKHWRTGIVEPEGIDG